MGGGGAVELAFLQDSEYLVHGLDVGGEEVVDEEALFLAAADLEFARRGRVDQVADLLVVDLEVGDANVKDRLGLLGAQAQLVEEIVDGAGNEAVVLELILAVHGVLEKGANQIKYKLFQF